MGPALGVHIRHMPWDEPRLVTMAGASVPPVIIPFNGIFHYENQPAIGVPPFMDTTKWASFIFRCVKIIDDYCSFSRLTVPPIILTHHHKFMLLTHWCST